MGCQISKCTVFLCSYGIPAALVTNPLQQKSEFVVYFFVSSPRSRWCGTGVDLDTLIARFGASHAVAGRARAYPGMRSAAHDGLRLVVSRCRRRPLALARLATRAATIIVDNMSGDEDLAGHETRRETWITSLTRDLDQFAT
jgi:hypothetical protein